MESSQGSKASIQIQTIFSISHFQKLALEALKNFIFGSSLASLRLRLGVEAGRSGMDGPKRERAVMHSRQGSNDQIPIPLFAVGFDF
jgi:hypothetical protein